MNLLSNSFFIAASALLFNWIFPFRIKLPLFFCCWGQFLMNFSSQKIASAFERTNLLLYEKSFIHKTAPFTRRLSKKCNLHLSRSLTCCRWLRFITSQNFMQKQRVFRLEEILHVWHRTLSWHRNCIWRLFKWIFLLLPQDENFYGCISNFLYKFNFPCRSICAKISIFNSTIWKVCKKCQIQTLNCQKLSPVLIILQFLV